MHDGIYRSDVPFLLFPCGDSRFPTRVAASAEDTPERTCPRPSFAMPATHSWFTAVQPVESRDLFILRVNYLLPTDIESIPLSLIIDPSLFAAKRDNSQRKPRPLRSPRWPHIAETCDSRAASSASSSSEKKSS
jgi:hypothetical protein